MKKIFVFISVFVFISSGAFSQELDNNQTTQFPVLTLNQTRLLQESRLAQEIYARQRQTAKKLQQENQMIDAELKAEEAELAMKRKDLPPQEFKILAEEFDQKVITLRAQQAQKEAELITDSEKQRQVFLGTVSPVLLKIAEEYGAVLVLDSRTVLVSASAVDITDQVIAEIDGGNKKNTLEPK